MNFMAIRHWEIVCTKLTLVLLGGVKAVAVKAWDICSRQTSWHVVCSILVWRGKCSLFQRAKLKVRGKGFHHGNQFKLPSEALWRCIHLWDAYFLTFIVLANPCFKWQWLKGGQVLIKKRSRPIFYVWKLSCINRPTMRLWCLQLSVYASVWDNNQNTTLSLSELFHISLPTPGTHSTRLFPMPCLIICLFFPLVLTACTLPTVPVYLTSETVVYLTRWASVSVPLPVANNLNSDIQKF